MEKLEIQPTENPEFEPAERMIVAELHQLRVMASTLRCAIIDEIAPSAKTVAEVGAALGGLPTQPLLPLS